MPEPTDPGLPRKESIDWIISQLHQFGPMLSSAAMEGEAAFTKAANEIKSRLELLIKPAMESLGEIPKKTAKDFEIYQKQLKEIERTHKAYYSVIANEEEKRVRKIRDRLSEEVLAIRKRYQEELKAAGDNQEKLRELEKQRQEDIGKVTGRAEKETSGGALTKIAAFIPGVGELLAAILTIDRLKDVIRDLGRTVQSQALSQVAVGGALAQITGASGVSAYAGRTATAGAFGGLIGAGLDPERAQKMYAEALLRSPQLQGQNLAHPLGQLVAQGMSPEESLKKITEASQSANVGAEQYASWIHRSRQATVAFGVDTSRSLKYMLDFAGAMRTSGADTDTATKQAEAWTFAIEKAGKTLGLSQDEIARFQGKVTTGIQGMDITKLMGLTMATTGRMPVVSELSTGPKLIGDLYSFFKKGAPAGEIGEVGAIKALASQLGIGTVDVQTYRALEELVHGQKTIEQFEAARLPAKESTQAEIKGSLAIQQGFLKDIRDIVVSFKGIGVAASALTSFIQASAGLGVRISNRKQNYVENVPWQGRP